MYAPAEDDESTTLQRYIDQQLTAIRAAAFGLTEGQSRQTPCRSALSIAGIIKHVTYVMRGAMVRASGAEPPSWDTAFAGYTGSFVPTEGETTAELIADFDAVRVEYLAAVGATDPDAQTVEPPAPWHGRFAPQPIRWRFYLGHQLEEMARHAGHADIIREQLDGASVPALVLTREGAPANDFFQPFVPEPGTLVD